MRIITGKFKSRKLNTLPGPTTRPMTDRMKESIFNIIGPYFQGETVLDLFGGSGALSFEAISRGASFTVIVEKDYKAYQIIQSNQKLLELTREEVLTLHMDYRDGIKYVKSKDMQFDLVFLDPPYRMHIINELLETLLKENLVKKNTYIICHYEKNSHTPQETDSLKLVRNYNHGNSELCIYQVN
ncbi:MAG TPA: 16S rRNA (guanine(966)-N(2))-methyltransferase RsmD [Bacilli bacterium]|nr:16S rRNA (guanine(966)-N(2))-methyltransferase RsmD [Bacilli bacterium]